MSQQPNGLRVFHIFRKRNVPPQRGPVTARVARIPYGECNPADEAKEGEERATHPFGEERGTHHSSSDTRAR